MSKIKIFTSSFFYFITVVIISAVNSSCKKFVEVQSPKNQILQPVVFSNDATATSATIGLYSLINKNILDISYGGTSIFTGLAADEIYNTSANSDYDPFSKNSLLPNTYYISSLWTSAYKIIYAVNAIVEGLSVSNTISDSIKQQLTGEAKFVRAFHYYLLVNMFGDVPLILSTDYQTNSVMSRTPESNVYAQIVEDLKSAQLLMSDTYYNADNTPGIERVRPNKSAVSALLARIYLYLGDWKDAEVEATSVINNSSLYELTASLNNVFLKNSKEIIWQVMPVLPSANTAEGRLFNTATSTSKPIFAVTTYLNNAFETGDQRKVNWTKTNVSGGQSYTYPYKYKIRNTGPPYGEYNVILRLAEQYLIRAEARAQQGNIIGSQDDLNIIRSRAGLPNTTANDKPSLLLAIEHERQIELFSEWGHRWFDLKRTGRINAVLGTEKNSVWQTFDTLFPIPQSEIKYNHNLSQNSGY